MILFIPCLYFFANKFLVPKKRENPVIPQATAPKNNEWNALVLQANLPKKLKVNQDYTFTITMKNTGTNSWHAEGETKIGMRAIDRTHPWLGATTEIWLSPSETIGYGDVYNFTFSLKAPATSGTYRFFWRMVRMKGRAWQLFGEEVNQPIEVIEQ